MAIRLLPFRQYNEHDVINLFRASDTIITSIPASEDVAGVAAPNQNGNHDNGVLVSIASADFTKEPVEYGTDAYLQNGASYRAISTQATPMRRLHDTRCSWVA